MGDKHASDAFLQGRFLSATCPGRFSQTSLCEFREMLPQAEDEVDLRTTWTCHQAQVLIGLRMFGFS